MKIFESMTRLEVGGYTVRVWRQEEGFVSGPSWEVTEALKIFEVVVPSVGAISEVLEAIGRVNAYEVLDKNGNGLVVYTDWP